MKFVCLNSGNNGSGMAGAIAIEAILPNAMSSALYALCLVNAGDSIQRFCMDSNVKFSKLQFIVITSLSPHCISGLPGLILGLSGIGLERLTIVGPVGLKDYMNSVRAFTNRAYPVCDFVELTDCSERIVEFPLASIGDLSTCLRSQRIVARCKGVAFAQTMSVIGGCCSLSLCGSPRTPSTGLVGCFPVPFGLTTVPSLEESLRWAHSGVSSHDGCAGKRDCRLPCAVFVPLECVSGNIDPLRSRTWVAVADACIADPLLDYCVFADGCLRPDVVEYRTAQSNNLLFNSVAPQLFPAALSSLAAVVGYDADAASEADNSYGDVELDFSDRLDRDLDDDHCRILRAAPLLSVSLESGVPGVADGVSWVRTEKSIARNFAASKEALRNARQERSVGPAAPAAESAVECENRIAAQELRLQLLGRKRKLEAPAGGGVTGVVATPEVPPPPSGPPPTNKLRPPPPPGAHPASNMTITFLGTGSATPSRHRNNTSIMLRECSDGIPKTILLDVGEGTSVQLFYHCSLQAGGSDMEATVQLYWGYLRSIQVIWVSHHHGDHLSGLLMLMEQVRRARLNAPTPTPQGSQKILLIGSTIVLQYAETALRQVGLLEFVDCYHIGLSTVNNRDEANFLCGQRVAAATSGWLVGLVSIPVLHCPMAFAVVLVFYNGRKIVYSGDCRPVLVDDATDGASGVQPAGPDGSSRRVFAKHAVNCDLLIHESTFEDALLSDAISKRHSTISEALTVGRLLRAKSTVLTHFSQRYPKKVDMGTSKVDGMVLIAFDLMTISMPFPHSVQHCRDVSASLQKVVDALTQLELAAD